MNILLVADLHFSSNPRDAYRFGLFPWLEDAISVHEVGALLILGDLTEAKDYHSSRLVNKIVDSLCRIHRKRPQTEIFILPGNHDAIDSECPYFRFLGQLPFVRYMQVPSLVPFAGRNVLFLPHTKEPEKWDNKMLYDAEVIFMHQTVAGAKSETGMSLEGMAAACLAAAKKAAIWSGDVHVPQKVGAVEYVGAPYPVRFGDVFKPRAVLLTNSLRKATSLDTLPERRLSIRATSAADLKPYNLCNLDQIKVRVPLKRSEFGGFDKIKREITAYCAAQKVELCGLEVEKIEEAPASKVKLRGAATPKAALTPAEVLAAWCAKQDIEPALAEAGQKILTKSLG